jgi:hypothetical protein
MRFSAFIFPLLACGAGGYFAYHLEIGDHGLKARADLERRKEVLAGELAGLQEVRIRLERDVKASIPTCSTSAPVRSSISPIRTISSCLSAASPRPIQRPECRPNVDPPTKSGTGHRARIFS